jgi:DNA-binding LacI/PurR family transcriptional regulator
MDRDEQGKRSITQDDVARRAGVSRSIVSYVLNGGPRPVAQETRDRILEAIQELGYRPNKFAQKLNRSQNDSVAEKQLGIIMSDVFMLRRPYYADILAGIHNTAHDQNHHIRFIRFFQELKDPLLFNELIHKEEVSGIILIALDQSLHSSEDEQLLQQIRDRVVNIICIEWELEGLPGVIFNRQEAAYKATNHLIDCGLKNLLYIGPQDGRVLGFQQAVLQAGLADQAHKVIEGSNLSDGLEQARIMIKKHNLPEGILSGTDEVSMGLLRGLHEARVRVPEDISLVSIDNIEMAGFTAPPLTTVNVDTFEMGRIAVQDLIYRSKHPGESPILHVLPTKLILRESCSPLNS